MAQTAGIGVVDVVVAVAIASSKETENGGSTTVEFCSLAAYELLVAVADDSSLVVAYLALRTTLQSVSADSSHDLVGGNERICCCYCCGSTSAVTVVRAHVDPPVADAAVVVAGGGAVADAGNFG